MLGFRMRILWTYEHPTSRLEDMMLYPEAGFEIVPTLTEVTTSWVDNRYHDESHHLYPRWRSYVTLPVNVTEKIRRMDFWGRDFDLDGQEAALVNRHFDAI